MGESEYGNEVRRSGSVGSRLVWVIVSMGMEWGCRKEVSVGESEYENEVRGSGGVEKRLV